MNLFLWNRMLKTRSRSGVACRPLRPRIEGLESRQLLSITSQVVSGQLRVTDTNAVDLVTLDHSGSTTFVNNQPFADTSITKGILIQVGTGVGNFDTVNILTTVKPVTVDGQFDIGDFNLGKSGSTQGILAPVNMINFNGNHTGSILIDDSADPGSRNVTMNVVN